MSGDVTKRKTELMRTIVRGSRKKRHGRNSTQFESFVKHYFANVPPQDLVDKGPSTVLALATLHWRFGAKRKKGKPLVRAYNPSQKHHGYASDHTVIEIITDDMAYDKETRDRKMAEADEELSGPKVEKKKKTKKK